MSDELYYPPESVSSKAYIDSMEQYREMYERSVNSPDEFWAEQAKDFCWFKRCDQAAGGADIAVRLHALDVDAGLDGEAAGRGDRGLVEADIGERFAAGDAELGLDKIDTGDFFGDGVFDLETGVGLDEGEVQFGAIGRLFVDEDGYCVVHTIVGPEGGSIDRRYRPQPSFDVASAVSLYNELS